MKPGIYDKDNNLIREFTSQDLKDNAYFHSMLRKEKIKTMDLTVVVPKFKTCEFPFDIWAFFNDCPNLKKIDMHNCDEYFDCDNCTNLEEMVIPDEAEEFDAYGNIGCPNLKNMCINKNSVFSVENGVLYTKDMEELVYFPPKNTSEISKNTKSIKDYALIDYEQSVLKIPYGVKRLNYSTLAFESDNELTVILPDSIENYYDIFVITAVAPLTVYCPDKLRDSLRYNKSDIKIEPLTLDVLMNDHQLGLTLTEVNDYSKLSDLER